MKTLTNAVLYAGICYHTGNRCLPCHPLLRTENVKKLLSLVDVVENDLVLLVTRRLTDGCFVRRVRPL